MTTLSLECAKRVNDAERRDLLGRLIDGLGSPRRVLIIPPDYTRFHSGAGEITRDLFEMLTPGAHVDILPATGTHVAMSERQLELMFGDLPRDRFLDHDWRGGVRQLGEIPAKFLREVSGGRVDYPIQAEVDRALIEGDYDRILSVGQVVPHEVIGMANQNKNIFVGTGGPDTIHKTHFLGAVAGMENLMGREKSPVRDVLNYAEREFYRGPPISYILTVRARDPETKRLVTRGLYAGEGDEGFLAACRLSQNLNLNQLDAPLDRVVVYLDPEEFRSTWLGNKAVYRTRMAMADGGELIIIAPGLEEFGEDATIDRLIREHGYRTTPQILAAVERSEELRANLSAAAHLIHGSSEGRFRITYAPGAMSRDEIEGVGYEYADCAELQDRYQPLTREDGPQKLDDGEEFYFIGNPALGLWTTRERFGGSR